MSGRPARPLEAWTQLITFGEDFARLALYGLLRDAETLGGRIMLEGVDRTSFCDEPSGGRRGGGLKLVRGESKRERRGEVGPINTEGLAFLTFSTQRNFSFEPEPKALRRRQALRALVRISSWPLLKL